MMTGQSVVSVASVYSVLDYDVLTFLPLTGGTPVTRKVSKVVCLGSNGESLTVVAVREYSNHELWYVPEVYDNQGTLQQRFDFDGGLNDRPYAVAVSKVLDNSTTSSYYYVAASTLRFLTVYHSNGELVARHMFPSLTRGMRFRDEDNSLVIATSYQTIVFNIKTGTNTTFSIEYPSDLFADSVAFNANGSKMAVYSTPNIGRIENPRIPRVYVKDLSTGDDQAPCQVRGDRGDGGVSFATDGQGRSVVLAYWQVNSSTPLKVTVFVPDQSASSTAPIGAIIGGVLGGVALLVAAGVGFWLWKKRQAVPEETYVDMASVEPTVN